MISIHGCEEYLTPQIFLENWPLLWEASCIEHGWLVSSDFRSMLCVVLHGYCCVP